MGKQAKIKRNRARYEYEKLAARFGKTADDLVMELLFDVIFEHDHADPQYKEEVRLHWVNAEVVLGRKLPDKLYVQTLEQKRLKAWTIILKSDYFEGVQ